MQEGASSWARGPGSSIGRSSHGDGQASLWRQTSEANAEKRQITPENRRQPRPGETSAAQYQERRAGQAAQVAQLRGLVDKCPVTKSHVCNTYPSRGSPRVLAPFGIGTGMWMWKWMWASCGRDAHTCTAGATESTTTCIGVVSPPSPYHFHVPSLQGLRNENCRVTASPAMPRHAAAVISRAEGGAPRECYGLCRDLSS